MRRRDQLCVNRRKRRLPCRSPSLYPSSNRTSGFPRYGSPTIFPMCLSIAQHIFVRTGKDQAQHSRAVDYHPHIHVVIPSASINAKTGLWRVKSSPYFFSHKALAIVFRAKFLQAIVNNNLQVPKNCPVKWVVDGKDVGKGDKALIYLGRYLYRGVIQEKDILKCKNGMVTFRYLHSKTNKYQTRTVTGEYFLYLLMLHVLPKRFRRTRDYGFLHPCSKKLIKFLQLILHINPFRMFHQRKERPRIICPVCGAEMRIIKTRIKEPDNGEAVCYMSI